MENRSLAIEIKPIFNLLKFTFAIVPVVAGLDKFTNLLTDWEQSLPAGIAVMLPFTPHVFMMIVGVIEIIAGLLVFTKPALGGVVVAAWLTLIALILICSGYHLDIAVRDLVMAVAALSMVRLSKLV
jgi:uncharacterized membrane protein HdeD (DUF308 family)